MDGVKGQWDFPTDFYRPAVPSGNSKRIPVVLKESTVKGLKNLAAQVSYFSHTYSSRLQKNLESKKELISDNEFFSG